MFNLENLNEAQRQAVLNVKGPSMVLAGAGSGKTRTLVSRICYLLREKGVSPFRVLALTFSNKAAREMRERIAKEVSSDIGALQVTTFHSFCARLLRSEANYLGLSKNFTIYDTSESKAVVKTLLQRRGVSTKEISPFEILNFIEELRNRGHYPGTDERLLEGEKEDPFYDYYLEYESELHRANATDFGGLITGVIELFEKYPDVLKRYQERFNYLLVDEYQDTNRAQFLLVRMLSESHRNICVVGDEDQSIYSWRGADINNILEFEKIYPEAEILKLEQNYRSCKNIIEAASHVISRNTQRKGKSMWTANPEGESILICELDSDKREAEYITEEIQKIGQENVPWSDMAIFYRTNSQSRLIEDYLRKVRLPYRIIGGIKFYERKEVKDLLAYLRLVVNQKDSLALSRIINVPARGIGATTLRKLENEAVQRSLSLWELCELVTSDYESYKHLRLSAKIRSSLQDFVCLNQELMALDQAKESPSLIFEKALHESGYWEYLRASKDYESMARMENLEELGNAFSQFEETNPDGGIGTFLENITLDQSMNEDLEEAEKGEISLMTVHGAKGLEFPYVFVTGVEENVFPSYRSLEMGEMALEEERRLFYVAMTRAMKKLYICFAQGRMLFGQLKFNGPSRFIIEIPNKYYNWYKEKKSSYQSDDSGWDDDVLDYPIEEEKVYYSKKVAVENSTYRKGEGILHALYGSGKVIESQGLGSDDKVVVQFNDGTKKKFMVKFAPLQRM